MFNPDHIRQNFPVFTQHPKLVFVDNASTTQKPQILLDAVQNSYLNYSSNYHRTLYNLGIKVDQAIEEAKGKILSFCGIKNANYDVLFCSGTTDGFNKLANSIKNKILPHQNIVVSEMEHHSNFLPWLEFSKNSGIELRIIPILEDGNLDMIAADRIIDENTFLVSLVHISNTLGVKNDLIEISNLTRKSGALFFVDAAQSVSFHHQDFKNIDADAFIFSSHKMFGPTGLGIILMKSNLCYSLNPISFGGGMVNEVSDSNAVYKQGILKHTAGTPPIAQIITFKKVIDYLEKLNISDIRKHIHNLEQKLVEGLKNQGAVLITSSSDYNGIISFNFPGIHPHDAADFMNDFDISLRAGHHCTQLIMKKFNISSSIRISLTMYNSDADIEKILEVIPKLKKAYL